MLVGKDFAQGALVGGGHGSIRVDQVHVTQFRAAGDRLFGPTVFAGGVVEDQVHHQADANGAQIAPQRSQLLHRTERRVDVAVAADSIAAVIFARRRLKERHQVQVSQSEFLKIGDFGPHPLQVTGEEVYIDHPAEHFVRLEPVGVGFAGSIQGAQVAWPVEPGSPQAGEQIFEVKEEIVAGAVEPVIQLEQGWEIGLQPLAERLPTRWVGGNFGCQSILQAGH